MKKLLLLAIVAVGIGLYVCTDRYGVHLGDYHLYFAEDKALVAEGTQGFLAAIQFKDFEKAASYHSEADRSGRDIPKLIEKKFAVKPELLDIRHFEILRVEINPDLQRAKAVTTVTAKLLNSDKIRDVEIVFYWKKLDDRWCLDLQSSL